MLVGASASFMALYLEDFMDRRDFLKTAAFLPIALNIGGGSMLSKIPLNLDRIKKEVREITVNKGG